MHKVQLQSIEKESVRSFMKENGKLCYESRSFQRHRRRARCRLSEYPECDAASFSTAPCVHLIRNLAPNSEPSNLRLPVIKNGTIT